MPLRVALKCRLVKGKEDFNLDQWTSDAVETVIAIRRRQLEVDDIPQYTLHQLLMSLQSLFMDDVKSCLGASNVTPRVRVWIQDRTVSSAGDAAQAAEVTYSLMECDRDMQVVLQSLKDEEQLNVDLQLFFANDPYPVGTHGVRPADDPTDGPFPIDPQGQHVSEPTGAGLIDTAITCDVFVAGGGSAGVGAALGAARSGVSVVCVHGRPVLGGNASSEVKLHMVGADLQGGRGKELEVEAREGGVLEEIRLDNSMCNPQFCAEMLDLTFLDKFRSLPNMQLFLNTWFVSCTKDADGKITGAIAECQLTQRRYIITAKVYIDTTGDGRLGAEAKCQWRQGREAQSEYKESLAMLKADTATEGSSLAFHAKDMGKPMPFKLPPTFNRRFTSNDCVHRRPSRLDYGFWWVEMSWPWDTVSDGGAIAENLLEAMLGIWDYMKNSGEMSQDTTNWALDWFGYLPCKREARRIKGLYVQTQNDIVPTPTSFSDAVCHSGWGIDLHDPQGINDPARPPYSNTYVPYIYGTPLRCFVSADVSNMMMAGRLASFTHVAFGSQRVMATCCVHGQGAGTAAAYAALHMMTPHDVCSNPDAIWSIQQQLLRDDQFVPGQVNQDPRDKALTATVSASSEQDTGAAKEVISGQTRAVFGKGGCMTSQCLPGTNRWISNGLPATLTLTFKEPIASVGQVELVFDTGLHRFFTFSISAEDQSKMIWGEPMPETVKDYTIEALAEETNSWQTVMTVTDNYQRKRVHMIGYPAKCTGVRITVTATNGIPNARICEVRVYEIGNGGKFPVKPKGLKPHPLLANYDDAQRSDDRLQLATSPEPSWWKTSEIVA
eukprot:scpid37985/ scgid33575/ 